MSQIMWVLGAADPEMEIIESLLRACGQRVGLALNARGERVFAAEAYRTVSFSETIDVSPDTTVYAVEGDGPAFERAREQGARVVTIDHHRPGDPGYGRPPSEFLAASSIGQVIAELARIGRLPMGPLVSSYEWAGDWEEKQRAAFRWFHWETEARTAFSGGALFEMFRTPYRLAPCDGYYIFARRVSGVVEFAASPDEMRDAGAVRVASDKIVRVHIPHDLVLAAAADHCLAAAYRGECPGVNPDELMRWRLETRAKHQGREVEAVLADVELARQVLRDRSTTDRVWLCPGQDGPTAVDMRGMHVPELPEASARENICFIADGLPGRDGRVKIVCQSGSPEQIRAFMQHWAPSEGLTEIYGDPARGFAGGYRDSQMEEP